MVTLVDPTSGRGVHLRVAQIDQTCPICRFEMKGRNIVNVDGDYDGWTCQSHLERRLFRLDMSEQTKAQQSVREFLREATPGDKITVTRTMLVAFDAGRL